MGRPAGRRNANYERERERLLELLMGALLAPGGATLSFREMAEAAGVSPATLRHYFGTRDRIVAEVLGASHRAGLPYIHAAATRPIADVRESLGWLLETTLEGWRMGVGAIHALGLTAGLRHDSLGPAYVNEILEPSLQAAEARIARHVAAGDLAPCDIRHAALELVSPVLLAMLHQDGLGGTRCRPLDIDRFVADHLDRFLRAHAPPSTMSG